MNKVKYTDPMLDDCKSLRACIEEVEIDISFGEDELESIIEEKKELDNLFVATKETLVALRQELKELREELESYEACRECV